MMAPLKLHTAMKRAEKIKAVVLPRRYPDGTYAFSPPIRIKITEDYTDVWRSFLLIPNVHVTEEGDIAYSGMRIFSLVEKFELGYTDIAEKVIE